MRIFLLILLLGFSTALTDDSVNRVITIDKISPSEEEIRGCKVLFINKDKPSCSKKKTKRIYIAPIKIPNKQDKKLHKLEAQLNTIIKEFAEYKRDKDKEVKKIKTQLSTVQKQLSKNRKKLATLQKSIKKKRKVLKKREKKKQKIIKKREKKKQKIIKKREKKKQKIIKKEPEPISTDSNLPWVDIVVEDGIDIYQLALRYYKDKKEYKQIYLANKNIIGKDLKIRDGMLLKIPITDKFEEQPMFLNRY